MFKKIHGKRGNFIEQGFEKDISPEEAEDLNNFKEAVERRAIAREKRLSRLRPKAKILPFHMLELSLG